MGCNDLIPVIQGQLTGDDCRSAFVAVFNDLKHITPLVIIEFFRSPVIENEKVGFGELLEDPAITSVASREGKCCKQPWNAVIGDGEILSASFVA
ncbi:hypothetical protein GCM10007937_54810 [Mesorhizobium albiziae]|nr:hypothetical protein GCM10007937_54810 [Mesorhizobium albiziae]